MKTDKVDWTEERREQLRDLIEVEGLTFAQAGKKMGISRLAALGKAFRMNLKSHHGKPQGVDRAPRLRAPRIQVQRRPASEPATVIVLVPKRDPDGQPFTILTVSEATCKWPLGDDPATITFCGHSPIVGSPYCPYHYRKSINQNQTDMHGRRVVPRDMTRIFGGG